MYLQMSFENQSIITIIMSKNQIAPITPVAAGHPIQAANDPAAANNHDAPAITQRSGALQSLARIYRSHPVGGPIAAVAAVAALTAAAAVASSVAVACAAIVVALAIPVLIVASTIDAGRLIRRCFGSRARTEVGIAPPQAAEAPEQVNNLAEQGAAAVIPAQGAASGIVGRRDSRGSLGTIDVDGIDIDDVGGVVTAPNPRVHGRGSPLQVPGQGVGIE